MWTLCLDQLAVAWISLVLLPPRVNINKRIGDTNWIFFLFALPLCKASKELLAKHHACD